MMKATVYLKDKVIVLCYFFDWFHSHPTSSPTAHKQVHVELQSQTVIEIV